MHVQLLTDLDVLLSVEGSHKEKNKKIERKISKFKNT